MRKFTALLLVVISLLITRFFLPQKISASIDPVGIWQSDTNILPYTLASHVSTGFNGKLFVITGSALSFHSHNDVIFSTPDILGNLNVWNYDTPYPKPMIWSSSATAGNRLYILGGFEEYNLPSESKFSDDYVYMSNNSNPLVWISTTHLPIRLSKGAAAFSNGYIYYSGGWTDTEIDSAASNKVYYAQVNGDGSLGAWSETTPLPNVLWSHGMIEGGGYMFVIGGTNGSGEKSNVYSAKINTNGTLGLWTTVPSLPSANRNFGITKVNNYVFVVGGRIGSTFFNTVHYTTIDDMGNMEPWQTSINHLLTNNCCGSLTDINGHLYLTGGLSAPGLYVNSVYHTRLNFSTPTPTPTSTTSPTPTVTPTSTSTSTPTPTTAPTLTPTPSPLPNLNVPDIKQYSNPWGLQIYDSAGVWSAGSPYIKNWGCALTSASMILKFWGHGNYANPDNLNTWLKSQADGYLENGLLNWLAVTRLSKVHSNSTIPSLEYKRLGNSFTNLSNELENGKPSILKEPGHFVVAKSKTSSSFGINDPAYFNRSTLSSYGNTFNAIYTFSPTYTDLSYILLTINPQFTMRVFDPIGNEITGYTFIEGPLINDLDNTKISGDTLKIFEFPKPADGDYQINISGNGNYKLSSYIYDDNGNVYLKSFSGNVSNNTDTFSLITNSNHHLIYPTLQSIQNNFPLSNSGLKFVVNKFRVIDLLIQNKEYESADDVVVGLLRKVLKLI